MPGTGPPPKDPKLRQRRNKTATKAEIALTPPKVDKKTGIPPLPPLDSRDRRLTWDPSVREWWRLVWTGDVGKLIPAWEVSSLVMIARLRHDIARSPDPEDRRKLMAELRLQERRWGLDEMSRRSLQWSFSEPDAPSQPAASAPPDEEDPRKHLRAVK